MRCGGETDKSLGGFAMTIAATVQNSVLGVKERLEKGSKVGRAH